MGPARNIQILTLISLAWLHYLVAGGLITHTPPQKKVQHERKVMYFRIIV